MDSVVTWGELIKIVLFFLGAGVLFYLLLAVSHLVGILKNINKMLEQSRESITGTIEQLPGITENVAKVSDIVKEEMEGLQKIVGNIGKISDTAKDTAEMLKNDIVVKAKNILDLIDWIRKLFNDKGGKKKDIVYKYKYKPNPDIVEETVDNDNDNDNDNDDNIEQNKTDNTEEQSNPSVTNVKVKPDEVNENTN